MIKPTGAFVKFAALASRSPSRPCLAIGLDQLHLREDLDHLAAGEACRAASGGGNSKGHPSGVEVGKRDETASVDNLTPLSTSGFICIRTSLYG